MFERSLDCSSNPGRPVAAREEPCVLVVDDAKAVRDVLAGLLRRSGYRVVVAENGFAAQLLLTAMRPTLILSDLHMPLSDGWDLLTFCHEHHADIPVILMSGGGLGQRPEIEQWAAGFFSKPIDVAHLQSEIGRRLRLAA